MCHFVSIGPEQYSRNPRWRPSHLIADDLIVDILAAFYNQFIMYTSADKAVRKVLHCEAEKIAADGLDDVLDEFRTVGFDSFPFLCGADAHVGDGFTAEGIFFDTGFYVRKHSAREKLNEEHSALVIKVYPTDLCVDPLSYGCFDSPVDILPEGSEHRVRSMPGINQWL